MHVRRYYCATYFGKAIMLTFLSFSNCQHSQLICRSHSFPNLLIQYRYGNSNGHTISSCPPYIGCILSSQQNAFLNHEQYMHVKLQSISKSLIRKYSSFLHQQSLKFHYPALCMDQEHDVPKVPCEYVANLFVKTQYNRNIQQHCLLVELWLIDFFDKLFHPVIKHSSCSNWV